ncbi:MAG: ATP-binding protein [Steroidobacteraceae bacterium]|nr:ATP-binding protein [Steroidobacteraceae bacterium]
MSPVRGLRRWLDASIMRKSLAVIAMPLLLLVVSIWAIDRLERQNVRAEDDVRRTLQVLSDLHEAHSLLAETAAAVRGYRLVGHDNFLDPYRAAQPNLLRVVDRLGAGLTDASQRRRFERVRPLFEEKLAGWSELLDPALPPDAARAQLIDGKAMLDILRGELRAMREFEIAQLDERVRVAQQLRRRNLMVTQAAALLAGLGAVLAVGFFAAGLARRAQRLSVDAAGLGEGRIPAARDPRSDEIGQVQHRLVEAGRLLAEREAETRRAREDAESANRAKTDFLSRSSHELRTPLNAILGYAQVLELDLKSDHPGRAHARQIVSAGRHLLGLIGELLDVARIESDRVELDLEAVAAGAVLDEALALVRPDAERAGIALRMSPVPEGWTVRADRQRLRQVLVNVLGNAVKFNRPGGEVRCRTLHAHDHLRVEIEDDGPGLPAEHRERLFTPFERLGAELSAVEGTGLGLALSRRLLDAMGGRIATADRAPGHGACFVIELPLDFATDVARVAPDVPATEPVHASRDLLCVEDNPSNRALLDTLFARRPAWRVRHAGSLAEARAALVDAVPDVVLLDLHLPDGRGELLLEWMRVDARRARIPVVALSADATPATIASTQAAGVHDYLTKPLDVSRFFAVLDRLLARTP